MSPTDPSHAIRDRRSRERKARKIESILGIASPERPLRMLEVGAGSGWISHYFGEHPSGRIAMHAVDVDDLREVREGFDFYTFDGVRLPFPDAHFDVVISNHVLEHVGDGAAQQRHLQEIARVLRADGRGYLAFPNRWALVEPHYRLPLLSWWPERFRSTWLRLFRGIRVYDCRPLSTRQLAPLMRGAGLAVQPRFVEAVRATADVELPAGSLKRAVVSAIPGWLVTMLGPLLPTLIFTFRHDGAAGTR